jgi:hypothetical protein
VCKGEAFRIHDKGAPRTGSSVVVEQVAYPTAAYVFVSRVTNLDVLGLSPCVAVMDGQGIARGKAAST